jgi:hypothetical protein
MAGLVNLERLGLIQLGAPIPKRYPHVQTDAAGVLRGLHTDFLSHRLHLGVPRALASFSHPWP